VPVKDEARDLWDTAYTAYIQGCHDAATEAVRTFLATRDAGRDAEVAELRKAADCARISLRNSGYDNEWTRNLSAALDEANAREDRMRAALKEIALLRPHGDINTCKQPRMLVENMEWIALKTLDTLPGPAKRAAALSDLAALDGESMGAEQIQ
jgi:hypothetical protein